MPNVTTGSVFMNMELKEESHKRHELLQTASLNLYLLKGKIYLIKSENRILEVANTKSASSVNSA